MATRSRSGPTRTRKASTSSSITPGQDEQQGQSSRRTSDRASTDLAVTTDVTGSILQRREIPSFSLSREARIAEAAYWRAERRGFQAGHELDDWLEAEKEIDHDLAREGARAGQN